MKATRLTLIGLAAIAIIFSGCSKDSRITAPGSEAVPDIDKNQSELTAQAETENNAARIAVRDDGSNQEELSILAEVNRTEVEGGCFYLTAENGDNFTPVTPKSLSLELGMVLKASGYIDKNIQFFCGNGPAFVIEQFEILKKAGSASEDYAEQKASDGKAEEEKAAAISAQESASKEDEFEKRSIAASDTYVKRPVEKQSTGNAESALTASAPIKKKDSEAKQYQLDELAPWKSKSDEASTTLLEAIEESGIEREQAEDNSSADDIENYVPGKIRERYIQFGDAVSIMPTGASEERAPEGSESDDYRDAASADTDENNAPGRVKEEYPVSRPLEDRAPQGSIENRDGSGLTFGNSQADESDNLAPAGSESDDYRDGASADFEEDNAPGKVKEEYPVSRPTEDRAPAQEEDNDNAVEMKMHMAKPVPIIFDDAELNSGDAVNILEGYTRRTKEGCLMLTTDNKEVFELQHDMDVLLLDGTYIRVTGYISTLPYWTCEEATVFHAETIKILAAPKEAEAADEMDYSAASDDYKLEYVEAEGVMQRTEPEGMCWYFQANSGERYELIFSEPVTLQSGMKLKVKGLPSTVATFCQSGKALEVMGWEPIYDDKF